MITRRKFIQNGVAAFTFGVTAPAFLSELALAQGATSRNLVLLDLSGGNDGLSMLIPYNDSFYYSRRPTLAIPAGTVLQVGSDSSGKALGLHPRLTGLKDIFNEGRLALIQRVGYENSSRSHFLGTDVWSTANPSNTTGNGWVGRYLSSLPPPLDPLVAWNTTGDTPHALLSSSVPVASIPSVSGYAFNSPNTGADATLERGAATSIASHVPVDKPHVAFVSASVQAAMATLDRVAAGGLFGTGASLAADPQNPTLENHAADVKFENDFRSVYAKVVDNWLGGDSAAVLGANFRRSGLDFLYFQTSDFRLPTSDFRLQAS